MTLEEAKKRAMDDAKKSAAAIAALNASAKKAPVAEDDAAEETPLLSTEGMSRPGVSSSSSLRKQGFGQKSMSSVSFAQEDSVRMIDSFSDEHYESASMRSASAWFRRMYNRSKSAFEWTTSLRDHAIAQEGLVPAAFLLRDAILGNFANVDDILAITPLTSTVPYINRNAMVCRRLLGNRSVRQVLNLAVGILVLLTFLEPPSWCRFYEIANTNISTFTTQDGARVLFTGGPDQRCHALLELRGPPAFGDNDDEGSDETVDYYPNFHMTLLTVNQSLAIEFLCVLIILAYMVLRIGRDGFSLMRYFRKEIGWQKLTSRFALLLTILGLLLGMSFFIFRGHQRPFAPFLRIILFIIFSKDVRRELTTIMKLMPELLSILFLLFVVILFYGWIGVVAFYDSPEGADSFSNLVEAMWTLWICVTTANYPDVMMASYNQSRWTVLYFVSFMMVTFFFMMNIILASVVNSYDNDTEAREKMLDEMIQHNLKQAFQLLCKEGTDRINRDTIMSLFLVLNEDFHDIRRIPPDDAKLLFAILDKDGSNTISEEEFMDFGNVLLLKFEKESEYKTLIETRYPQLYASEMYQKFVGIVQSNGFDYAIDLILFLNAIVVFIQSYPELMGEARDQNPHVSDGYVDTGWELLETAFTIVYCIEMLVKIMTQSWKGFIESQRNRFDFLITVLAIFATAYVYYPNTFSDSRLIRYIVMARVLRLARLLIAMEGFRVIGGTFQDVLPAATRVLLLLFCIMYTFAAIGMMLFGGQITRDPQNPLAYRLQDTDFSDNAYWANNFNDMLSGINVLFNLLVVNNWPEQADGLLAVTQSKASRLFFLAFHIIAVILINNIVIAFIIDSFMSEWDEYHEKKTERIDTGEAVITSGARAIFDASEVTGTKTELQGGYVAKLRKNHKGQRESQVLKAFFTRSSSNVEQNHSSHSSDSSSTAT